MKIAKITTVSEEEGWLEEKELELENQAGGLYAEGVRGPAQARAVAARRAPLASLTDAGPQPARGGSSSTAL